MTGARMARGRMVERRGTVSLVSEAGEDCGSLPSKTMRLNSMLFATCRMSPENEAAEPATSMERGSNVSGLTLLNNEPAKLMSAYQ